MISLQQKKRNKNNDKDGLERILKDFVIHFKGVHIDSLAQVYSEYQHHLVNIKMK